MSTTSSQDADLIRAEYQAFMGAFRTVLLATTSQAGVPEASYAPFVYLDQSYHIYVSQLAIHTRNLLETQQASLLFIEDEASTPNLFARRRVSLHCMAEEIPRDSEAFDPMLDHFEQRFGKFMQMLRGLQDFHLIRLRPQSGNYVAGFGKAFALGGEMLGDIRLRRG